MNGLLDITTLCKQWVHSKEEDTSLETVYRPPDYAFPPSRGRSALVFHSDGTMKRIGIAPTDISAVQDGTWRFVELGSGRIEVEVNNTTEELTVQSLERDRLEEENGAIHLSRFW